MWPPGCKAPDIWFVTGNERLMRKVLHILMNKNGLNIYPSVYNALYCWSKLGWSNHIIAGGPTGEFSELIEKEYRFSGGYAKRAAQLASIAGYYDIVIVYDPQDLEAFYATRWLLPRNSYGRLVHHCLEIPTIRFSGSSLFTKTLRKILGGGYRLIDHLIVQDHRRAELFLNTFPYLKGLPVHLVTNSFVNSIEPISTSLGWFDDLRAQSQFLILYTGAIEPLAVSEQLLNCLLKIPEATFLFSGWSRNGYADTLSARYGVSANVHFSVGAKARSVFNYMVANSDVGLVCYEPTDQNVHEVGLSSGKMHKFLSFQKPVLTNRIPSLHEFVTLNGFGMSVAIDDFAKSIRKLSDNYPTFCENIRERYSQVCNFEREYMAFAHDMLNQSGTIPALIKAPEEARAW